MQREIGDEVKTGDSDMPFKGMGKSSAMEKNSIRF